MDLLSNPRDILKRIVSVLGFAEQHRLRSTCRALYSLVEEDPTWTEKHPFYRLWPVCVHNLEELSDAIEASENCAYWNLPGGDWTIVYFGGEDGEVSQLSLVRRIAGSLAGQVQMRDYLRGFISTRGGKVYCDMDVWVDALWVLCGDNVPPERICDVRDSV